MAARKKKTSKKKTVAGKKPGTALMSMADMQRLLAGEAEEIAEKEVQYGGTIISTKGKKFTIGDTELPVPLPFVIVAHSYANLWYDRPYDPQLTTPPACFAVSETVDDIQPHPNSPDPQGPVCDGCPMNEFASAATGRGKACRNTRRLVGMLPDDESEDPALATVSVAPTGIKGYGQYVRGLAKIHKRPPHGVVTELSFVKTSEQPVVECNLVEVIEDPNLLARVLAKRDEAVEIATAPIDVTGYESPTKGGRKTKKKAKKKASRRARY